MRTGILILFFLAGFNLSAQTYVVMGKVSSKNGEALPGASIVDRATLRGVASFSDGSFRLELAELPAYLEVSFIGYENYYQELKPEDFDAAGRVYLDITLTESAEELRSVTVTGAKYEEFYVYDGLEVLDFWFVGAKTLLLLRRSRKEYAVSLINEREDTLGYLRLPFAGKGFEEDCLNHIYLKGQDSLYGLTFYNEDIYLLGGLEEEWYNKNVKPCISANSKNLYYQFYSYNNQLLEYFQTPLFGEQESFLIHRIIDEEDAYSIAEYKDDIAAAASQGKLRKAFEMEGWFKNMLSTPIYNPLFTTTNGAIVFDHLRDSVIEFNELGRVAKTYYIRHHHQDDFKEEILHDAIKNQYYIRYEEGGITKLTVLSSEGYKILGIHSIQKFDFPQKLKIRNGVAYFLDHMEKDQERLKLYRQVLD